MLVVICPKCKHNMKYMPSSNNLKEKRKRCVYCGYSFTVKGNKSDRIQKIS